MAKITQAHLRDFLKQYQEGSISFGRFTELLNEVAESPERKTNYPQPSPDIYNASDFDINFKITEAYSGCNR